MRRGARRSVFVMTMTVVLLALLGPAPAAAHIAGGASPTNSRSVLTEIQPEASGVALSVGLGGQFVRVVNRSAAEVMILGYRGEPFLRLSQQRVQVNPASPTAAQTGQLPPGVPGTAATDEQWVDLDDGDGVSWTDARVDGRSLDAGESQSWTLPLEVDGQQVTASGTRAGLAAPSPWPWLAALGLLAVVVARLSWRRDWHRPMAAATVAGVVAYSLNLLGTGAATQPNGPLSGWVIIGVLGAFLLLVATITVVGMLRRSELAPARLPMMAITLVLLAGTDITGLWSSQLPFAGPAVLDRGLLVVSYGVALGLLVAGIRLARQPGPAGGAVEERPTG